jgi:catechol 2,3-dioxygenase
MSGPSKTAPPAVADSRERATRASASGLVPVMHHINLKTARLQEIIEWYGSVVGMTPNFRWDGGAFLANDGANHRMAIFGGDFLDDPDRRHRAGLHHSAFEFESLTDLLDHYAALRARETTPAYCLNHGLTTSFYYRDPDGNHVELQSDNFGDWAKSSEFIQTSERFRSDPIGQLIDPAAMYDAKSAGVSDADLARRSYAGEFAWTEPVDMGMPED